MTWSPEASAPGEASGPDLLVVDTYDPGEWSRIAATLHGKLVAFSDAAPAPNRIDVIVAPEDDRMVRRKRTRVLNGLRFACLRRDFWDLPPREIREPAHNVLVTTGGGDGGDLATRLVTEIAEHCPPATEIELVWGPGFRGEPPSGVTLLEQPRSLREPLLRADVVVCAGGQTMLEAAATGAPIVAIEAAPNQRFQIAALREAGGVFSVPEHLAPVLVEQMLESADRRRGLSRKAQQAVDGRGALRVAAELAN